MNWIWVDLLKFLNREEYFSLFNQPWLKGISRGRQCTRQWKTNLTAPPSLRCLPRNWVGTRLTPSVGHNPCLGHGHQERRIYCAIRCSPTGKLQGQMGEDRTESTWWEYLTCSFFFSFSYSLKDLSIIKLSETQFLWFFPFHKWNVSNVSRVNATNFECLSAALSLSIC